MKTIIFDSSSIISLALNNLLYILKNLKKEANVSFVMTEQVKKECIDKPIDDKKYELEAMMIRQLVEDKLFELTSPELNKEISVEITNVLDKANHTYRADDEWMKIIGLGEASCIALSNILDRKKVENILAIDERTARMLCEKPENLRELFSEKLHREVSMEKQNLPVFENKQIIRSAELCYVAFKKNLVGIHDGVKVLDALLYASKFKGCAISRREIDILKSSI